jgi:hypothetical protein
MPGALCEGGKEIITQGRASLSRSENADEGDGVGWLRERVNSMTGLHRQEVHVPSAGQQAHSPPWDRGPWPEVKTM